MEDTLLAGLEKRDGTAVETLKNYNLKNEKVFKPAPFDLRLYKSIWKHLMDLLSSSDSSEIKIAALSTLKILSRNKENLNETVTSANVEVVLFCANLTPNNTSENNTTTAVNYEIVAGAQKCLSNFIFNSTKVQQWCSENQLIRGLIHRLKLFKDAQIPHEVRLFDIRLIFLISGVVESTRMYIRNDCEGFIVFIELFEYLLYRHQDSPSWDSSTLKLTEEDCDLCNESLKALYNILHSLDRTVPSVEDERHCLLLVPILRDLLLSSVDHESKHEDLISNSVNLLLLMPPHLHRSLLKLKKIPEDASFEASQSLEDQYEEMSAITVILDFLKKRLNDPGESAVENLAPVLSLMIEITLNERAIRKFVRQRILPPLKDVSRRPEEGDHIRNKLCALMTSPIPQLKTTSADLLFILCKEKVGRLIKYAGYGNAAGFLASRGLMTGGRSPSTDYSTDSEDSDTEEYERVKDQVNPVTGRLEPEHISPFEGMTEEQKETEAMKLVNALDKLNKANLIQPCVIGDDGKPRPLNHVNELLEKDSTEENNEN